MRASEYSTHHLIARATTGQRIDIQYDPRSNSIVFVEDGWAADMRGAQPRTAFREPLETATLRRLPRRFAA